MEDLYGVLVLPILIFVSRVADVGLGTIRIIYLSRGMKWLAATLGFFEVLIWVLAMGQIFSNVDNLFYYIIYALGFATGNVVGILLEQKIATGLLSVQIITSENAEKLTNVLYQTNFGVTTVSAKGMKGKVRIIYSVIKRSSLNKLYDIVREHNPKAFVAIESVQTVSGGVFPARAPLPIFVSRAKKK